MPKIKTHKGTAKRFKVTSSGKIIKRKSGQNHFNSREPSKVRMNKRRDTGLDNKKEQRTVKTLIQKY